MESKICRAIVLLPQTTFKFWGIPGAEQISYSQARLPVRLRTDRTFEGYYYRLNKMIVSIFNQKIVGPRIFKKISSEDLASSYIDSHILNLFHHYRYQGSEFRPNIVEYNVSGYTSLVTSDIRFPIEYSRGIKRNLTLKSKFNPNLIWAYDNYAKEKNHFIKFGWDLKFIDKHLIASRSNIFIQKYLKEFRELANFNQIKPLLIICPKVDSTVDVIISSIEKALLSSENFSKFFKYCDQIIIKPHRLCLAKYPKSKIIFGKNFVFTRDPLLRVLPVEILRDGFENAFLLSTPSSAVFSGFSSKNSAIMLEDKVNYYEGYQLLMKRYKVL
jgi:hypothetical protein